MVEKCGIINKSQVAEVEQIIYYLKNRAGILDPDIFSRNEIIFFLLILSVDNSEMSTQRSVSRGSGKTVSADADKVKEKEKASIRNLDEYVELLYEDLQERVRGSSLILRLARCPDNLEELERNGT